MALAKSNLDQAKAQYEAAQALYKNALKLQRPSKGKGSYKPGRSVRSGTKKPVAGFTIEVSSECGRRRKRRPARFHIVPRM